MTRTMLAPSRSNSTLALRLDFCMSDHAVLGSPRQMQGRLKLLLAGLTFASTLAILVIVLHTTSSMATTATRERWIRRKRAELRLSAPGPSPSRHLQHTRLNIISQTIPDHLGTADHSITPGPTGLHPEVRRSGSHHNVSILARMPCKDGVCYQYLSLKERQQFENCVKKTQDSEWKFGHVRNGSCHFMKSTELYPVALASFPGSGNTWVRGLLEKATGICTGAIYCDGSLRTGGFTGEGIAGPSTLVVKTHGLNPRFPTRRLRTDLLFYRAAIFLVRNPRDALVAEWNRERTKQMISNTRSNHYLSADWDQFGNNTDWDSYLRSKGRRWLDQVVSWLALAKTHPILVVRYEDIKDDTLGQVKRMLDFLMFHYTEGTVRRQLEDGYTNFYRNHTATFEHYTSDQRVFVNSLIHEAAFRLKQHGVESVLNVDDYLS